MWRRKAAAVFDVSQARRTTGRLRPRLAARIAARARLCAEAAAASCSKSACPIGEGVGASSWRGMSELMARSGRGQSEVRGDQPEMIGACSASGESCGGPKAVPRLSFSSSAAGATELLGAGALALYGDEGKVVGAALRLACAGGEAGRSVRSRRRHRERRHQVTVVRASGLGMPAGSRHRTRGSRRGRGAAAAAGSTRRLRAARAARLPPPVGEAKGAQGQGVLSHRCLWRHHRRRGRD